MFSLFHLVLALALLGLGSAGLSGRRHSQNRNIQRSPHRHDKASLKEFSLGCHMDDSNRTMTWAFESSSSMTPNLCSSWCAGHKYLYAAVADTKHCFCGNALDKRVKTSEMECTYTCPGDKSKACGGSFAMNIFALFANAESWSSSSTTTSGIATSSPSTSSAKTTTSAITPSTKAVILAVGQSVTSSSSTLKSASPLSSSTTSSKSATASSMTSTSKLSTATSSSSTSKTTSSSSSSATITSKTSSSSLPASTTSKSSTTASSSSLTRTSSTIPSASPSTSSSKITSSPSSLSTAASSTSKSSISISSATPKISSSVIGVAAPPSATGTKSLYAHHIVGNTYSYTQATWADDIAQASAAGIDGFALNLGSDSWESVQVSSAYAAAQAQGSFKLFLSLDMTSLSCSSTGDATNLANLISAHVTSPSQVIYKSATLVSTFAGDACTFGQSNVNTGWASVRNLLSAKQITIHLIPAIFPNPSTFPSLPWLDGELNWNSGWPTAGRDLDGSSDTLYMQDLGNKTYMPAISPCFFTYYGPNTYNKDWIYRSDDWLLAMRMEMIVAMRNKVDFAEIISWNDYGESHYIGPVRVDQPNSQGWTNGMPHTAWLSIIAYYAPAFKTGAYRTPTDNLWLWSRPHPKAAIPSAPTNPKPTGWNYTDDNLYAFVTLASPATVLISSGKNTGTWSLPSGVSKLSLATMPGSIGGKIVRGSATVKSYDSTGTFTYAATPTDYNFNYFVAQA